MNREKRRKFAKEARKKGIPDEYIDAYLTMLSSKEIHDDIKEDEKVMVNVERVVSSKNYATMNDRYNPPPPPREGQVFTAHIEDSGLISLKESPEWLFWEGDLLKFKEAV